MRKKQLSNLKKKKKKIDAPKNYKIKSTKYCVNQLDIRASYLVDLKLIENFTV